MKNYNDFLNENDTFEERNWQVTKNDSDDSWWEYKSDAIDRILEIIDLESQNDLEDYEYDDEKLSIDDIRNMLEDESEEDFYTILDEIKKFVEYSGDIKLYNIADDAELEFLKDDETYLEEFD